MERPRKTTPGQARLHVRQVKKDPFMTTVDLAKYAQDHLNLNMTDRTARNILIRAGLRGRVPANVLCCYFVSVVYLLF